MGRWNLESEYQRLVKLGVANGNITVHREGPEQRQSPRIRMQGERVSLRLEPEFDVVDMSASGMAFLSEVPFAEDQVLQIVLKDMLTFQGRVVGCQVVETDPCLMELRYRVQCRFQDPASGKHLLVLMREMERLDAGVPAT